MRGKSTSSAGIRFGTQSDPTTFWSAFHDLSQGGHPTR
jgi:hypothetical protein